MKPNLYKIHGGWGHHIEFMDWDSRRIHGHLPVPPQVGDYLQGEMGSGKQAIFKFTEVEYMRDPPDQFFGTVEDVGYREEIDFDALGINEGEVRSMFV